MIYKIVRLVFCISIILGANASLSFSQEGAASKIDILKDIGIDQHLDEQIPLDLPFKDEFGQTVHLKDYFGEKPVILSLVYYDCPMLCTMILNGLLASLNPMNIDIGKDFEVVTVSFNPAETPELAMRKKTGYVEQYDRSGAKNGWHFLTGDEASIKALTNAVGFRYRYDEEQKQFVHASGIMVLTPDGTLSKYFYGIEYPSRDLKLGLIEASKSNIGSFSDQVLLYCYHYDPTTGKYGLAIMNVLRFFGTLTIVLLGGFMFIMLRKDHREKKQSNNHFVSTK